MAVTDDTLVQSIGELRRALGDDGPRLIKTIPRRGYRFELAVSAIARVEQPNKDVPDSAIFEANVRLWKPIIRAHVRTSLTAALTHRRAGPFAVLTLAVFLAIGTFLTGYSEWKILGVQRSGDQFSKVAEIGTKPAIAILPFVNQPGDSAREYFADGLTQDIINVLGRFSTLTVMSWNAVSPYKGKSVSPGEIARALAVRYQVEGSVWQTGDRVRVTAELVDFDGRCVGLAVSTTR